MLKPIWNNANALQKHNAMKPNSRRKHRMQLRMPLVISLNKRRKVSRLRVKQRLMLS